MNILHTNTSLYALIAAQKQANKHVGFVPTMGALHLGHISLINQSKKDTDFTICSIFVNPTQFNDAQDFEKYPRTVEQDISILAAEGCDTLFLPSVSEIYPESASSAPKFDFGYLAQPMEGAFRPGHFNGMAQVVKRLLELVQPDKLFMGQKDYQQLMIVRRMLAIIQSPVELIMGETLREADGLAMSSRNVRLSATERQQAAQLYRSLQWIKTAFTHLDIATLKNKAFEQLTAVEGMIPEYVEIVDADTLYPVQHYEQCPRAIALVAAQLGKIRLIDNLFLN